MTASILYSRSNYYTHSHNIPNKIERSRPWTYIDRKLSFKYSMWMHCMWLAYQIL